MPRRYDRDEEFRRSPRGLGRGQTVRGGRWTERDEDEPLDMPRAWRGAEGGWYGDRQDMRYTRQPREPNYSDQSEAAREREAYDTAERAGRRLPTGEEQPYMRGADRELHRSFTGMGGTMDDYSRNLTGVYGGRPEARGYADMPQGAHAGKGPRGYTRSDERIHEDVCEALTRDSHLDASRIEVAVQNGEVTLSGSVERRQDKRRAEDLAEACSGVRHVQNNLRPQQLG